MRTPFLRRILVLLALGAVLVPVVIVLRVALWAAGHVSVYVKAPRASDVTVVVDGKRTLGPIHAGDTRGVDLWRGDHLIEVSTKSGEQWRFPVSVRPPWTQLFSLRKPIPSETKALTVPGTCYAQVDVTDVAYGAGGGRVVVERRIAGGELETIESHRMLTSYRPVWLDEGERLRWWLEIDCEPEVGDDAIAREAEKAALR